MGRGDQASDKRSQRQRVTRVGGYLDRTCERTTVLEVVRLGFGFGVWRRSRIRDRSLREPGLTFRGGSSSSFTVQGRVAVAGSLEQFEVRTWRCPNYCARSCAVKEASERCFLRAGHHESARWSDYARRSGGTVPEVALARPRDPFTV
jgi:hypothetical protein